MRQERRNDGGESCDDNGDRFVGGIIPFTLVIAG